jgi:hypothetical protein
MENEEFRIRKVRKRKSAEAADISGDGEVLNVRYNF